MDAVPLQGPVAGGGREEHPAEQAERIPGKDVADERHQGLHRPHRHERSHLPITKMARNRALVLYHAAGRAARNRDIMGANLFQGGQPCSSASWLSLSLSPGSSEASREPR